MKTTIGAFLLDRLRTLGITRMYGVPGDFNLEFLELVEDSTAIEFIGNCNELNASYAADGDARISGISALATTYGVGDLGALPGVAGAYAEGTPVVMISGAPPLHAIRSRALLHHTLADGNYTNMRNCFREFTVAETLITPENAVVEIDRVLRAAWLQKAPVYLQLPSDICYVEIETSDQLLDVSGPVSDARQLHEAATLIAERLQSAKSPILLLDNLVRRYALGDRLHRISDTLNIPYASLATAKGILDESSPRYAGMYGGKASSAGLFERVAQSDFVLGFGVRFVDATSGWFSQSISPAAFVNVGAFEVTIGREVFAGVAVCDLLDAVLARLVPAVDPAELAPSTDNAAESSVGLRWGQPAFWNRISRFLEPGDVVVAENGTSLAGMNHTTLPKGCKFISQPVWGAIGYTLPALLGSLLAAPDRRHLLFIGDGSFQLTAQEVSTILRHRLKPIIFLLNNSGYTIERLILGEKRIYNDIANWDYSALPAVLGPKAASKSVVVNNMDELETALTESHERDGLLFIEVRFEVMDSPVGMPAFGKMAMHYDYGRWADAM